MLDPQNTLLEDEMVGWHHQFNGHELGQTLGDGEGQGSLACRSPWGRKESDTTWQLNNNRREKASQACGKTRTKLCDWSEHAELTWLKDDQCEWNEESEGSLHHMRFNRHC